MNVKETQNKPFALLLVKVPKTNDKKELAAEQMFAALHGIAKTSKKTLQPSQQEHISFEIVSLNNNICFYIWTPFHLKNFVEGQIYAQYSTAQIYELPKDYAQQSLDSTVAQTVELQLINHETIPIRTFTNFVVDPLAGITATLARLEHIDEKLWIQILARPISSDWHKKSQKQIKKIKGGKSLFLSVIQAPFQAPEETAVDLSERDRARISAIEEKNTKLGYQVKIRLVYLGQSQEIAALRMQALLGAFKQFNSSELNGFEQKYSSFDKNLLQDYINRSFVDEGFILNTEELASVFHLPHTTVDTPTIDWMTSKTAEPPSILPTTTNCQPKEISCFGVTNFRSSNLVFGSLRADRGRHLYIVGQTGTGKSGLLELLALSDIKDNHGYAIVDPHGDFAINNLHFVPEHRITDVVYFNPADSDFPISFNPLEVTDSRQKVNIASDLIGVMKRMFDSWGPRLEHILRNTLLALLDNPQTTMLDITRMLTDKNFRKRILQNVQDVVVLNFWHSEFSSWSDNLQAEAVSPVLNKVGAFISNPIIRNIVGQPKSSFDIRKIMDEGKILILNLSRGLIGEDNANILGAMIITKIQLAAMSRADTVNIEDRRPFYLYVDEFQNFATDSFAVILSEARKYGLYLTLANQYISQMSLEVRGAVFGNIGTIVSFRVSPEDAPFLEKYFEPQFDTNDLIQLANRDFITTMTIRGEKVPAFSGRTLAIPSEKPNNLNQIIAHSQREYTKPKDLVEKEIKQASHQQLNTIMQKQQAKELKEKERALNKSTTKKQIPHPKANHPVNKNQIKSQKLPKKQ